MSYLKPVVSPKVLSRMMTWIIVQTLPVITVARVQMIRKMKRFNVPVRKSTKVKLVRK